MKENGRKMLELSQQVLQKVSFDPRLFFVYDEQSQVFELQFLGQ